MPQQHPPAPEQQPDRVLLWYPSGAPMMTLRQYERAIDDVHRRWAEEDARRLAEQQKRTEAFDRFLYLVAAALSAIFLFRLHHP